LINSYARHKISYSAMRIYHDAGQLMNSGGTRLFIQIVGPGYGDVWLGKG